MNFEIKLNIANSNNDLHSDILISFHDIDENEIIDSYYFFDGINFSLKESSYFENLGIKLIDRLQGWIKEIDNGNLSHDNLFIIDVSDEYIGAFRLFIVDEYYKLTYGTIRNPIPFEITDFVNEYEPSLFMELYEVSPQISISNFKNTLYFSINLIRNQIANIKK